MGAHWIGRPISCATVSVGSEVCGAFIDRRHDQTPLSLIDAALRRFSFLFLPNARVRGRHHKGGRCHTTLPLGPYRRVKITRGISLGRARVAPSIRWHVEMSALGH